MAGEGDYMYYSSDYSSECCGRYGYGCYGYGDYMYDAEDAEDSGWCR